MKLSSFVDIMIMYIKVQEILQRMIDILKNKKNVCTNNNFKI